MTAKSDGGVPLVKEYVLNTVDDIKAMRADEEFCDGAVAVLSFPKSDPQVFISYENPKYWFGQVARLGDRVGKDLAGNFYVNGKTK